MKTNGFVSPSSFRPCDRGRDHARDRRRRRIPYSRGRAVEKVKLKFLDHRFDVRRGLDLDDDREVLAFR